MSGGMIFVCIIVGLILAGIIAGKFGSIAEMKGHSSSTYFWWCFLLGIFGMLMVIALPDRTSDTKKNEIPSDELPEL